MEYTTIVNPDAGRWLRWAAKWYDRDRSPHWLWPAALITTVVLLAAVTELLPFEDRLQDSSWGIVIGLAAMTVAWLLKRFVMWRSQQSVHKALETQQAARVPEWMRELWRNEIERIGHGNGQDLAWDWLIANWYEPLVRLIDRHQNTLDEATRRQIAREMRVMGYGFRNYHKQLEAAP